MLHLSLGPFGLFFPVPNFTTAGLPWPLTEFTVCSREKTTNFTACLNYFRCYQLRLQRERVSMRRDEWVRWGFGKAKGSLGIPWRGGGWRNAEEVGRPGNRKWARTARRRRTGAGAEGGRRQGGRTVSASGETRADRCGRTAQGCAQDVLDFRSARSAIRERR